MINELTSDEFGTSVLNTNNLVLVNFSAKWCAPCHMQQTTLEEWAESNPAEICIYKVDVNRCSELAMHYQVRNIPTLILFKEGKEVVSHMGLIKKNELTTLINEASSL